MEAESPDLVGPEKILYNLAESSVRDRTLGELGIEFGDLACRMAITTETPNFVR